MTLQINVVNFNGRSYWRRWFYFKLKPSLTFITTGRYQGRCPRGLASSSVPRHLYPGGLSSVACCDMEDDTSFQFFFASPGRFWFWQLPIGFESTFSYPLGADRLIFLSVHPSSLVWTIWIYLLPSSFLSGCLLTPTLSSHHHLLKASVFILSCCLFFRLSLVSWAGSPQ